MKVLKNNRKWIDNNKAVLIFSLFASFLIWLVIAYTFGRNDYSEPFTNVRVDLSAQSTTFAELGFNAIEMSDTTVTAIVKGDRIAVTSLSKEDLVATASPLTNVTEKGIYEVKLVPSNNLDNSLIKDITYKPDTIRVKFDRLQSKTFEVEPIITGLTMSDEFVKGAETITPSKISITGPDTEIEKINRCIIKVELNEPLDKTYSSDFDVVLIDNSGNEIDPGEENLKLNYPDVQFTIEMLKTTGLELKVGFTNQPRSFVEDLFQYDLDPFYLEVAGPVDLIDQYNEVILGYIDIREISKAKNVFRFDIDLPERFKNINNIDEGLITFNTEGWGSASFSVEEIKLLNIPEDYSVRVIGNLEEVGFCGYDDILSEMTSKDIVAEIDLSSVNLEPNIQLQVPVRISAPTKGFVWAVGEYYVIVKAEKLG